MADLFFHLLQKHSADKHLKIILSVLSGNSSHWQEIGLTQEKLNTIVHSVMSGLIWNIPELNDTFESYRRCLHHMRNLSQQDIQELERFQATLEMSRDKFPTEAAAEMQKKKSY